MNNYLKDIVTIWTTIFYTPLPYIGVMLLIASGLKHMRHNTGHNGQIRKLYRR